MKSVVICRSNRFYGEAEAWALTLREKGVNVFNPPSVTSTEAWASLNVEEQSKSIRQLGLDHFQKIDESDVVFIFNKDGYIGASVTMELGYALARGKWIVALEHDKDLGRDVFYNYYVTSPDELAKFLKEK